MTIEFDLNNLNGIYSETINSPEKAVAFDMNYAKGRFLFMLFLSDEDKKVKINYLYICEIQKLCGLSKCMEIIQKASF